MLYDGTYTFDMPLENLHCFGGSQKPPIFIEEKCAERIPSPSPIQAEGKCVEPPHATEGQHIIILVHGLDGNMTDLNAYAQEIFIAFPKAEIIRSKVNARGLTSQLSIAQLGKNLADEVTCTIQRYYDATKIAKISFVAFSLGGLIT